MFMMSKKHIGLFIFSILYNYCYQEHLSNNSDKEMKWNRQKRRIKIHLKEAIVEIHLLLKKDSMMEAYPITGENY
jgi:hypothetical protein